MLLRTVATPPAIERPSPTEPTAVNARLAPKVTGAHTAPITIVVILAAAAAAVTVAAAICAAAWSLCALSSFFARDLSSAIAFSVIVAYFE